MSSKFYYTFKWGLFGILIVGIALGFRNNAERRSNRIKQQDNQIADLKRQLANQEIKYRQLARSIKSYRQVPVDLESRPLVEPTTSKTDSKQKPEEASLDSVSDKHAHWLLDIEDENSLGFLGQIIEYGKELTAVEWDIVETGKGDMLDIVKSRLTKEQRQAIEELEGDPSFDHWLDELLEISVLDSMRVEEEILMETE
ncbi:hypothetical protein N8737_01455 [Verrucomicrobia bacterium]|nr:hypothetical protein [Verrucomicrobiota bacterium]MDA7657345.1 hypothetical protein [Verrucomicrobiota bacterium]